MSGARPYSGPYDDRYKVNSGDIVLATRQQSDNLPILAMPAMVPDSLQGKDIVIGTNLYKVEITDTTFSNVYIYWLLKTKQYVNYIAGVKTGTTVSMVTKKNVEDFTFFAPSNPKEREEIASILSSLDDKIAVNKKICENLEAQAQALFKHWFVDFAPFKDGKFVESELGLIPEGWRVGRLGEVADITSGKRPPKKSKELNNECNIPLIGAADIMGYTSSILYKSPILIIGRVGTHGVVQRWKDACWPSDNTLVIESQYYNFTYQQLKNIDYSSINRGSTQPLITQTDVKNTSIIIPTRQTLEKYESIINILYDSIYRNNKESARLATLRDTLLPKLMSGEIKI